MNYRHAYHAGNFADVIKHIVLSRVIVHLREKPAAFRIIDTHAGTGKTNLSGAEASRTGEWRNGIGRIFDAAFTPNVESLLQPYLDAIKQFNPRGNLLIYPGSPMLALSLMRAQDRLLACELEPVAAAALTKQLRTDKRAKAVTIDGWTALSAYVPPVERRGAVLVDPPFEQPGELDRLAEGLADAYRKWTTGTYLLWYPIKNPREIDAFARKITKLAIPKVLRIEAMVHEPRDIDRLNGTGLIAVNPPWMLESELSMLLPPLASAMADNGRSGFRVDWLTREK
ncbi:MAG TPA: 23S rRNA (adenine(2030)-N(6))-methyltransferase RlmJ [Xanthobacteraceae bacterium]|nr:23S rRNA (adenine(2030)-N(6))-methyltransferase RlmJ [Xanthobacteraceae bacterium]